MKKIKNFLLSSDGRILGFGEDNKHIPEVLFDLGDWAEWCATKGYDAVDAEGSSVRQNLVGHVKNLQIVKTSNGFNWKRK